MTLLNQYL